VIKKLGSITNVVDSISTGTAWVGIVAMWSLVLIIATEIMLRALFSKSLLVTLDVSKWLLVALVFMGIAWTLKAEGHIRIGLISSHLSQRKQQWLLVAVAAVGVSVFAFVACHAWQGMVNYYVRHTVTVSMAHLPLWPVWLVLFVGSALLCLQFAATVVKTIGSIRSTPEQEGGSSRAWAALITVVAILAAVVSFLFISPETSGMNPWQVLLFLLVIVFTLILSSAWIFLSLTLAGILAMYIFTSYDIGVMTSKIMFNSNASFVLTCLPLFIFMGELLFRSGISKQLYNGIAMWVERIPGGLFHSNILACTIFAAISGSSAATAATIGTVAVPELKRLGYDEGLSVGSLAGAGTLGLLIPPSIALIVYGAVTGESIGQLFLGGIIPGLMLAGLFMLYIGVYSRLRPSIVPRLEKSHSWGERMKGLAGITPTIIVIGLVLGLIYAGVTTPTEAGAVGVIAALGALVLYRNISWRVIKDASWGALRTSCMIMLIIAGANVLASTIGYLRAPQYLAGTIEAAGLSKYVVLFLLALLYLGMGCLFEGVSMMVLTLPIVYPLIIALGFNGIWFGIVLTVLIEEANITPPVGFNLYVLQKIAGRDIGFVVKHTMPFFFLMLLGFILLVLFPQIALILPNMMIGAG